MRYVIGLCALSVAGAFVVVTARWIDENYVVRPERRHPAGPFHNPGFRPTAELALRRFGALAPAEKASIRNNLQMSVVDLSVWLEELNRPRSVVVCLGEDHEDATRRFLARRVFSALDVDTLLLEVTPDGLGKILQRLRWKRERVALLGADIAQIIRVARRRNPALELFGIEETKAQRLERRDPGSVGTRDRSIGATFWGHFQHGRRYAILFGALHCTSRREWLYGRLRHLAPRRVVDGMFNVRVFESHQDGSVEAFAFFLDAIGVRGMSTDDAVVVDSKAVHPAIRRWFELLAVLFEDYAYVVIFAGRRQVNHE